MDHGQARRQVPEPHRFTEQHESSLTCMDDISGKHNAGQAHIDALALGRAFAIVGTDEDRPNTPLVTVESPLDVHADLDPLTRKVRTALERQFSDDARDGTNIGQS